MADRRFHDRRSIRLPGWDYRRAGWYFVTLNTWGWCHTLARVRGGRMEMTRMGEIVDACWAEIPGHYPHVALDEFVVMPNHIHGIVVIKRSIGVRGGEANQVAPGSLSAVVRSFKAASTRIVHREIAAHLPLWHRNFYERILLDRRAILAVQRYIRHNPARWIAAGR
jgi:REP element-mobilizing transposase RayT